MPLVPAFHTTSQEYSSSHRNVYHDNSECGYGMYIKPPDRLLGSGGRPRCDECERLEREGR